MGASTALALTDRGQQVTIFDALPLGHTQGSSHGNSRIIRRAYPDPFYTEIMQKGYEMWSMLQTRTGESFVHETGLLYFGSRDSTELRDVIASLTSLGVLNQVLEADQLPEGWRFQPNEIGVFTPEAGWVDASRAVDLTMALALDQGAEFRQARVDPGTIEGFDSTVVCAGPWIQDFVPVDVRVTTQTVAYVQLDAPVSGPVWIEDGPDFLYGFPSEQGQSTIKIGVHQPGVPTDPHRPERPVDPHMVELIKDFAHRRLGIASPVIASTVTCLYTNTADEDFRLGEFENGFWVSPCSGHGFKFGPWIGQLMADLVEGKQTVADWPRFCPLPEHRPQA